MKFALPIVAALSALGCFSENGQRTPFAPAPPPTPSVPPGSATVWALVVEASGVCVDDARLEVVDGQRVGEVVAQVTPCDAWSYGAGAFFKDVTPGVAMTIRASAPGYKQLERTIVPSLGPYTADLFVLPLAGSQ